ncbi:VOC family protein [Inquilinus sp. NPDC058860]|uniref:VOC family protein n=1 Tax=Inquilinus sp. NPDC058860 TaxID=3346652 RepID=UPI00368CE5DC
MTMMFDHVSIGVADLARSRAFYDAALAPLGYGRIRDFDDAVGYGEPLPARNGHFWIAKPGEDRPTPMPGLHLAFRASDRAAVDAVHAAALAAGGRDNGAPGLRPHYHPNYYGAYVIDPDGHHVEIVCHDAA